MLSKRRMPIQKSTLEYASNLLKIRPVQIAFIAFIIFLNPAPTLSAETEKSNPTPSSTNAISEYFKSFAAYEDARKISAKEAYGRALSKVESDHLSRLKSHRMKKLETLNATIANYRRQLSTNDNSFNRPNTLLNLSLTLYEKIKSSENFDSVTTAELLSALTEIQNRYPRFEHLDRAVYLKANLLEELDRPAEALNEWKRLSKISPPSGLSVYASIAVGDHQFEKGQNLSALKTFELAKSQNRRSNKKVFNEIDIKIEYRIAWAAYRAAKLKKVLQSTEELLSAQISYLESDKTESIRMDAAELYGSALFESQNVAYITESLQASTLKTEKGRILLSVLSKFQTIEGHNEVVEIGEKLLPFVPMAREYPQIIQVIAHSQDRLKLKRLRMQTLEKVALLLPKSSLWRTINPNTSDIRNMESIAVPAAEAVGTWYFENGLATDNKELLKKSSSLFQLLYKNASTKELQNKWLLRKGHAQLFADDLFSAQRTYYRVKTDLAATKSQVEIASYQLILTLERNWRKAYSKAIEFENDEDLRKASETELHKYAAAADDFANKYPKQKRSREILLSVAGAYRDQGMYTKAQEKWERVLVASADPSDRSIAIRGITYAHIEKGDRLGGIEAIKRFLVLENWREVGRSVRKELLFTLARLAEDQSNDYSDSGNMEASGSLLLQLSNDVKDIPNRDSMVRDGAYQLAIAGKWAKASDAARDYAKNPKAKYRDDAIYLMARADEFQLKFASAAKTYYQLAAYYPRHSRSGVSLERAEKLASSEGNYLLAAQAASLQSKRARNRKVKFEKARTSSLHFINAKKKSQAAEQAKLAESNAVTPADKMKAQLLRAEILFMQNKKGQAEDIAKTVAKAADRQKSKIGRTQWAEIKSGAALIRVKDKQDKFDQFHVNPEDLNRSLSQKSILFEDMYDHYMTIISTESPAHSAKARFLLARASSDFAEEISGSVLTLESLPHAQRQTLKEHANRLTAISKKLHADNILEKRKSPVKLKNDPWISKSSAALSSERGSKNSADEVALPTALNTTLPNKWSL